MKRKRAGVHRARNLQAGVVAWPCTVHDAQGRAREKEGHAGRCAWAMRGPIGYWALVTGPSLGDGRKNKPKLGLQWAVLGQENG